MPQRTRLRLVIGLVVGAAAGLLSCSGSGGGGGLAIVVATSFQGFPAAPGAGPPLQFRNEVLLITLSGPVDNAIFSGFVAAPGSSAPAVFTGFLESESNTVLFHVYVDQATARQALQIFDDGTLALHGSGVVGRSATNPNVLVFDPRLSPANPFGLPASSGFDANTQYDVFIPADSGLLVGGLPVASFGQRPPVPIPPFATAPGPSNVFLTGVDFITDSTPPQVVEVTTMSLEATGGDPATDPILHDDTVIVRFSESIDIASVDVLTNLTVRNLSLGTPGGIDVPMSVTSNPTNTTIFLTPQPSFGPGPFDIEVAVGANPAPGAAILDLPNGPNGAQNPLNVPLVVVFNTESAPGQVTAVSVAETFDTRNQRDGGFSPRYNAAPWNEPTAPGGAPSGELRGLALDGSPLPGMSLGNGPGARTQVVITPNSPAPLPPAPTTYFSPFDDSANRNFGPGVNPNGGSHLQLLYLTDNQELPAGLADSIELMEWRTEGGQAFPLTVNGFAMRMGHTAADASSAQAPQQLSALYDFNFDFDNPQNDFLDPLSHPSMLNPPNEAPVLVVPPQPYDVGGLVVFSAFQPFPRLILAFDYDDNRLEANAVGSPVTPNLLVDIDVPAPVMPNANNPLGTAVLAPVPTRRLAGAPGAMNAFTTDPVTYHARFTLVKKNSSARTLFYDLGPGPNADYINLLLFPDVSLRPPGTFITVRIQGADALANGEPSAGDTGIRTLITRDGITQLNELDALDGSRFFRLVLELESDLATNAAPFVDAFQLAAVMN